MNTFNEASDTSDNSSEWACSSSSDEEDVEAAATNQSMFTLSTAALLLGANQMGMLDTAPARAPRRWQKRPDRQGTDLFNTMLYSWPKVGVAEQDRNYTRKFRVDKQHFD